MQKNNGNMFVEIINKIKENKKIKYLIAFVMIVLSLIVLFFTYNDANTLSTTNQTTFYYVEDLENRLSKTLSTVNGAGKVSVIITVESGMETVLATKTTEKKTASGVEIESTPIIVNGKTVVIMEKYPKIIGVLIVAEGADKIGVMNKIQQATVSLLNINVNQIEILSMK